MFEDGLFNIGLCLFGTGHDSILLLMPGLILLVAADPAIKGAAQARFEQPDFIFLAHDAN